jgi:hypothetical protein
MDIISIHSVICIILVILFGLLTSYQDVKTCKVKNKTIFFAVIASIILMISLLLLLWFSGSTINYDYFKGYAINAILSLLFGILLWVTKLWSAGDAKLFTAYSLLMPLSVYTWGEGMVFPSYIILINTFTPVFIYYLFSFIFKLKFNIVKKVFKKIFNPKLLLSIMLFTFAFSWISQRAISLLGISANIISVSLALIVFMLFINKVVKIDFLILSSIFSIIRLVFDYKNIFTVNFLSQYLMMLVFFIFLRYFIIELGYHLLSKPVYIEDITEGMCLADDVKVEDGKYMKRREVSISIIQSLFSFMSQKKSKTEKSIFQNAARLTKKDVEKLKKLHSEGKIDDHIVLVYEKVHFALFLFLGVVVTLICRGSIIVRLWLVLESFI